MVFVDSSVQADKVSQYMTKFERTASHPYTVITPLSSLSELEGFLKTNIFALGKFGLVLLRKDLMIFYAVTDSERKFVLAVATQQDLDNFVTRRGL